jgi:hypothetical protein
MCCPQGKHVSRHPTELRHRGGQKDLDSFVGCQKLGNVRFSSSQIKLLKRRSSYKATGKAQVSLIDQNVTRILTGS